MESHLTLTLQALVAPLFSWVPPTPTFAREDVWFMGLLCGLIPFFHTSSYGPMGVLVRSVRNLCLPLDQPAGSLTRTGLTTVLMAAGLWGGIGWTLSWMPTGGGGGLDVSGQLMGGLGTVGLILHISIIASLCNVTAVPWRAVRASKLAHMGNLSAAREMIDPLIGPEALDMDAATLHRRALESLMIWFAAGLTGGALAYLLFGLPGLFAYSALRTVARYVDRRGYGPEQATGPVVLEAISGYAAGCLAALLLALSTLTAPGTHLPQMIQGLKHGLSLRGRGRTVRLRRMALGPPLAVVAYACDVQLMGPGIHRPLKAAPDTWIGPEAGRTRLMHSDVLRGVWLMGVSVLLLLAFGAGLRLLALNGLPLFGGPLSLNALWSLAPFGG